MTNGYTTKEKKFHAQPSPEQFISSRWHIINLASILLSHAFSLSLISSPSSLSLSLHPAFPAAAEACLPPESHMEMYRVLSRGCQNKAGFNGFEYKTNLLTSPVSFEFRNPFKSTLRWRRTEGSTQETGRKEGRREGGGMRGRMSVGRRKTEKPH